jgi:DNA-binding NarL/FixJ family response regulator
MQRLHDTNTRLRVLHVDDNADARKLISYLVKYAEDLEEVGARDSAEGLPAIIAETAPDVLLIDLSMEGKDPIEAIGEVRAAFPALRIVVLTASMDPKLLARARAAGASEVAPKAVDIAGTLAMIRGPAR